MSARRCNGDTMGDCELCGATKVSTREHRVNKAMLAICQRCVGQMNLAPKEEAPGLAQARRTPVSKPKSRGFNRNNIMNKQEKELADNFAKLILNARESKGWTQAQLGQRMAETVNIIKSAEAGKRPTDSVIRKFEQVLSIDLMVERTADEARHINAGPTRGMTFGDYLNDLR